MFWKDLFADYYKSKRIPPFEKLKKVRILEKEGRDLEVPFSLVAPQKKGNALDDWNG